MAPQDDLKVGGVKGRQFFNVNAIAPITYGITASHVGLSDNATRTSFKGTISQMGLFQDNYGQTGQINGGTKPEYFEDGSYREPKTLCWA